MALHAKGDGIASNWRPQVDKISSLSTIEVSKQGIKHELSRSTPGDLSPHWPIKNTVVDLLEKYDTQRSFKRAATAISSFNLQVIASRRPNPPNPLNRHHTLASFGRGKESEQFPMKKNRLGGNSDYLDHIRGKIDAYFRSVVSEDGPCQWKKDSLDCS